MSDETLVKVEGVSKKFCRSLKRSLWYGLQDVGAEMLGRAGRHDELRKNEFWAVDDVSFELKRGECLGLIGPNGAGKSTLLKMLNGLIKPDKGRITMRGTVGALIELGAGFNPILTGRENIYINGAVLGQNRPQVDRAYASIVEFAEIQKFIDAPVQNYSSGMKVRLGFAIAAMLEPDVLLIDEVLAVGDARFRMKCYEHLLRLRDRGTSIIVVSHAVNHLSRVTPRCFVLDNGRKLFDGDISKAIGIYETRLLSRVNSAGASGSGASVDKVVLTDLSGNPTDEFCTGDTVCALITCRADAKIEGARLIVAIESPAAGILGSISTPFRRFTFDVLPPQTSVRLWLPNIPLLLGGYFLNVSLYGPDRTEFYARSAPAARFQITGPETDEFGFGLTNIFSFKHEWTLIEQQQKNLPGPG